MRTLYHQYICPFSRKVRIVLAEKKLSFKMIVRNFLDKIDNKNTPLLIESNFVTLSDSIAISEYLDECHPEPPLLGIDTLTRAEIRRLVGWFDVKFNRDVIVTLVGEKLFKRQADVKEPPDSRIIRMGCIAIREHLDYIVKLNDQHEWLAGEFFSLADITAAAHLSCVDYIGDVPWDDFPKAKDWYARIKSRQSFRTLLKDHLLGFPPSKHYINLDF
ncbi:MAG: glutathione S-transferase family protein [Rhodospirillaceae bacterium]|jgi:glutathione S-transferase|nr:glutathione S-transferase family protein [Rhodospirillaceae bacterium]